MQFSSVARSCLTLCDPMNRSTPGFPVHHQLPESTQTHVHWVGDAIQPSHPLSSPSPPALNLSQHQDRFQWVSSFHQVTLHIRWLFASALKYWSFSINPSSEYPGLFTLGLTGLISLLSKGLSRVFSSTTVQNHQFFHAINQKFKGRNNGSLGAFHLFPSQASRCLNKVGPIFERLHLWKNVTAVHEQYSQFKI